MNLKPTFIFFAFIIFILILFVSYTGNIYNMDENKNIRNPAVSGTFYPSNPVKLSSMINAFSKEAQKNKQLQNSEIKALIEPHAGYVYSGKVAAYGYNLVKGKNIKTIIILAPSHYVYFKGISIGNYTYYRTPLGDVKMSSLGNKLKHESGLINTVNEAHIKEHSLEVQLPFLQKSLSDFEIVPFITGEMSKTQIIEIAELISKNLDEETLIIASSDLSHFHSYNSAVKMDNKAINAIKELNDEKVMKEEMCGKTPILILINIAKKMKWNTKILKYANSGDITGDKESVVGYTSIAFYLDKKNEKNPLFYHKYRKKNY